MNSGFKFNRVSIYTIFKQCGIVIIRSQKSKPLVYIMIHKSTNKKRKTNKKYNKLLRYSKSFKKVIQKKCRKGLENSEKVYVYVTTFLTFLFHF